MRTILLTLVLSAFFTITAAFAQTRACDIEATSNGDYGVRELRTSGWVYILRGLSYDEAAQALKRLQANGTCQ